MTIFFRIRHPDESSLPSHDFRCHPGNLSVVIPAKAGIQFNRATTRTPVKSPNALAGTDAAAPRFAGSIHQSGKILKLSPPSFLLQINFLHYRPPITRDQGRTMANKFPRWNGELHISAKPMPQRLTSVAIQVFNSVLGMAMGFIIIQWITGVY